MINKVFKVIWSEARNAYVVVSEIAKNHGSKSCSTKKLLAMLIATGVMTCASMAPAMAANPAPNDTKIEVGKGASAVEKSVAIGNDASVVAGSNGSGGVALGNKAHAGYKGTSLGSSAISGREGTTLVGANTNSASLYTTVIGTDSVINSDGTSYKVKIDTLFGTYEKDVNIQGATATLVGTSNKVDNKNKLVYSGVANNVMGAANTIEASNGVTIQGSGNTVTDAYKDMNISTSEGLKVLLGDYSVLAGKESGAIAVVGGANTVSKQTDSTVIGYDNKLTSDKEKGSQNVFMAGSHNTLTNVSDSLVMGNDNTISDRSNVISFGYKNAITANNAVAIGNGASVSAEGGVALGVGSVADRANAVSVGSTGANRQIINVAAGTADTDAVNVSQLKDVKAEALKHNTVTNGDNITVTEGSNANGGREYNVALKTDIHLFGDNDAMVSISGSKGTIWTSGSVTAGSVAVGTAKADGTTPFFVDSNGAFYAADSKFSVDKDGNANANSIQTNALNAKYNLSVGTANENGTVPFFVNSNGAFYGANNNFSVDKDGKVTATAGEIGNVVLQNGVFTGHSALRDGELFVGDASGNYSQITTKGAKLGKVTVAADGKISGVAAGAVTADSTDAVNGSQLHAVATEASKHSKVVNGSNINVEETDNDGQKVYKVNLNKDIMLGDLTGKYVSISGTNGTIETTGAIATKDRVYADKGAKLADIDVTGNTISNGDAKLALNGAAGIAGMINGKGASVYMQDGYTVINSKVAFDQNGKISGVAAGAVTADSTDAVNGSQLNQTNENVAQNKADIAANRADIDKNKADIAANRADIDKNKADIAANRADIDKNKADIAANRADIDKNKADIAANRTDIDKNKADIKTLDTRVTDVEALAKKHTTVTAGDNVTVTEDTNKDGGKEYNVALDKDINLDSVTTGQTVMNNDGLKVGKDVSVTATAVTAGKTSISDEGVKVGDKTYISDKGLNANDQKVTNVAAGEISATSKDAVNGSQLYATNQEVANNTNRINKLGSRVNKVGAGAAALAALHPMDFDPDDKLTFSAGYGNYAGENAAAIGAYYRPDEKVMFSVAGTVGNGENMVNAGVSFALDRTNHVSNSRTALAREVIDLRGQLAVMGAKMAKMEKAFGMLDETKTKLFPDVPANHWAYEYIAKLAGNGYIEGYPDGNFGGDRLMTRYEFAAMLYRAIENGAALEEKIIKEFEPELGRIRVDRISGEDGDRDKIERVRVNDTKGERDHYGNKLAK
ncbi:ESPR-type extended signal peptide-containing protein [Phascolarctobacterium succinatutens]|uniref:ESPR-type extended signal peptide-containing protein n=1 Tax=Phascolarctobacterium succinatutens TaxID=626940 RepID=UPI003AB45487